MATRKKKTAGNKLNEGLDTATKVGQFIITLKSVLLALGLLGGGVVVYKTLNPNGNRIDVGQQQNNNRLNVKSDNPNRIPVR